MGQSDWSEGSTRGAGLLLLANTNTKTKTNSKAKAEVTLLYNNILYKRYISSRSFSVIKASIHVMLLFLSINFCREEEGELRSSLQVALVQAYVHSST